MPRPILVVNLLFITLVVTVFRRVLIGLGRVGPPCRVGFARPLGSVAALDRFCFI